MWNKYKKMKNFNSFLIIVLTSFCNFTKTKYNFNLRAVGYGGIPLCKAL